MKKPNNKGIVFCKIAIALGVIGIFLGLGITYWASEYNKLIGLALFSYSIWVSCSFYFILREPYGVTGWRRHLTLSLLEKSVHKDFLFPNEDVHGSRLHSAKRFTIFSFVTCLLIGYFGANSIVPSLTAGLIAALIYEKITQKNN